MKVIFCVILVDIYEKILQSYQIRFMFYFFPLVLVFVVLMTFSQWEQRIPFQTPVAQQKVYKLKLKNALPLCPSSDCHTHSVTPKTSHLLFPLQVLAEECGLYLPFLPYNINVTFKTF